MQKRASQSQRPTERNNSRTCSQLSLWAENVYSPPSSLTLPAAHSTHRGSQTDSASQPATTSHRPSVRRVVAQSCTATLEPDCRRRRHHRCRRRDSLHGYSADQKSLSARSLFLPGCQKSHSREKRIILRIAVTCEVTKAAPPPKIRARLSSRARASSTAPRHATFLSFDRAASSTSSTRTPPRNLATDDVVARTRLGSAPCRRSVPSHHHQRHLRGNGSPSPLVVVVAAAVERTAAFCPSIRARPTGCSSERQMLPRFTLITRSPRLLPFHGLFVALPRRRWWRRRRRRREASPGGLNTTRALPSGRSFPGRTKSSFVSSKV